MLNETCDRRFMQIRNRGIVCIDLSPWTFCKTPACQRRIDTGVSVNHCLECHTKERTRA